MRAKLTYYLLSSLTTYLGDQSWGFAGERVEISREELILKLFLLTLSSSPQAGVIHITVSHLTDGVHGVQRGGSTGTRATQRETRASEPRPGGLSVRPWLDQQRIRARWLPGPLHTRASVETADWSWLSFGPRREPWQRPPWLTPPASVRGVKCQRKRGRKVSHPEAPWSPLETRPMPARQTRARRPPTSPREPARIAPGAEPEGHRSRSRLQQGWRAGSELWHLAGGGLGGHAPDTPSEIHWGWGLVGIELGRRVSRAKSARQVLSPGDGKKLPGRGRVWRWPLRYPYRSRLSSGIFQRVNFLFG